MNGDVASVIGKHILGVQASLLGPLRLVWMGSTPETGTSLGDGLLLGKCVPCSQLLRDFRSALDPGTTPGSKPLKQSRQE